MNCSEFFYETETEKCRLMLGDWIERSDWLSALGCSRWHFSKFFRGVLGISAYALARVALVTGVFGFCPAWTLFNIHTRAARGTK